jgi:prolyl oligopeptidase
VRRTFAFVVLSMAATAACGAESSDAPPATNVPPMRAMASAAASAPTPPPAGPTKPAYPEAPKVAAVDVYRDVRVSDDYRWLEDWNDPKVKAWSEAENAFARKVLDAAPNRDAIRARVEHLMGDSSPSWGSVTARKGTYFAMERRPPKQQPYLVVLKSLDDAKSARVLVDPATMDPSGGTSIGWFVPSPDGKLVAVSLAQAGAERGEVHVFETATGKARKDAVPQADGTADGAPLAWKGDGSGFYYTRGRAEGNADNAFMLVKFHKLGDAIEKDVVSLGADGPRIAQWDIEAGGDGKTILAREEDGDSDIWDQWLLGPSGKWVKVASKGDGVKRLVVSPDGTLYILSSKDAPKLKLLRSSLAAPALDKAEVVLPEGDAVLADVLPTKSRLYLNEGVGGLSRVRSVPMEKGKPGAPVTLSTPPIAAIGGLESLGGDDVTFAATTFTQPTAWYRVAAKDGSVAKTALAATSVADFSGIDVSRDECTSKDGTKVPMTVLRPHSGASSTDSPALLTGYGGFGLTTAPRFRPHVLAWLEQGGVFAVANVRGGGEFGETWHTGGNLLNKQNVFDDFYACAQRLIEAKITTPAHLAIQGGSNGGLLMGAEIAQHPEAFKAVVTQVGIYDMLRLERDPNGAFNVTEYGSVADPKQFDALYAYSPYHHVKDGVAYPAVLFMTGANDPRVAPYHSRKMVARLQAATTSDAPILLRTSANTGHGIGSPLSAQIEEVTDVDAFLFQQLGVAYSAK